MGVCRSIKGVRTRRRGSSPGELLTSEIEKKKEKKGEWEGGATKGGKEGREEEKEKKNADSTVKRRPTQSVSFTF